MSVLGTGSEFLRATSQRRESYTKIKGDEFVVRPVRGKSKFCFDVLSIMQNARNANVKKPNTFDTQFHEAPLDNLLEDYYGLPRTRKSSAVDTEPSLGPAPVSRTPSESTSVFAISSTNHTRHDESRWRRFSCGNSPRNLEDLMKESRLHIEDQGSAKIAQDEERSSASHGSSAVEMDALWQNAEE